jgi:hypothetical protein
VTGTAFTENAATSKVAALPLAHLSLELGHLYMEDFLAGPARLEEHFRQVAPWAAAAVTSARGALAPRKARISTCFLVDDYFSPLQSPRELVPQICRAAEEAGLRIDYLARESGCARAGDTEPARILEAKLVADPPPGTNGGRPPTVETGWLCNGERSATGDALAAMRAGDPRWTPPSENAKRRHSIFVDVEIWDEAGGERVWSCPYLAAVWQLLRLGALRDRGRPLVEPVPWRAELPHRWSDLPLVIQLADRPAPFAAYRTFSVLEPRFMAVETAVRTILNQVGIDPVIHAQLGRRAGAEQLALPEVLVDRIEYAFAGTPWV